VQRSRRSVRAVPVADQARGGKARLQGEGIGDRVRLPVQRLGAQHRPGRIRVAPLEIDAQEACRQARVHERADRRTAAGEQHRHVRTVVAHQRRRLGGGYRVRAYEHDDVRAPLLPVRADPSRRQRRGHSFGGARHSEPAHLSGDRGRWLRGEQHGLERGQKPLRLVARPAEGDRERVESRLGNAPLELGEHPQLPRGRLRDLGDPVEAELQDVGRPPEERMGGIESEHEAIVRADLRRVRVVHKKGRPAPSPAPLWRRRRQTG